MGTAVPDETARPGEPDWIRHAVWWQVYPLGFLDAPRANHTGEPVHRLRRLTDWLGYAVELGASGLALGPIFESSTHGYDTIDHFAIDRRLGTLDDFAALAEAAHARGLRLLLDGVFNHVGRDFPPFRAVLRHGFDAQQAHWFRLRRPEPAASDTPPDYDTFEGHRDLVALNHAEPAVVEYVTEVMNHWLDHGADGWRLDAAYAVPAEFWADVLPRVRASHPGAYFVGEVIHGDYAAFTRASQLDALTQYEIWKAIWSALRDRNFFELAWSLRRHNGYLDSFVPLTFVGNHDVTRIASHLPDPRHLPHALAILFTIGGTPTVYYGDERAWQAIKEHRTGGDDAIRPPFPPQGPAGLDPTGQPTYRLHQLLIGLRRRHAWLHQARTEIVHLDNRHLVYRSTADGHAIAVALNLDDATARHLLPGAGDVLAGDAGVEHPRSAAAHLTVPPHGWAVFAVHP
jgi:cyclomaltodextrinase